MTEIARIEESVIHHAEHWCYVCGKTIPAYKQYSIVILPWDPKEPKPQNLRFDYYYDDKEKRQAVCSKECEMLGILQGI